MDFHLPNAPSSRKAQPRPSDAAGAVLTEAMTRRRGRDNISNTLQHSGAKVSGMVCGAELLDMKLTTLASKVKALGIV